MFNYYTKKIEELVKTDRYKNSNYEFQQVNGNKFALKVKVKYINMYVDLRYGSQHHNWEVDSKYRKDLIGSAYQALKAFEYRNPIIEPLIINKKY